LDGQKRIDTKPFGGGNAALGIEIKGFEFREIVVPF
jgi:hypothetical protein